jgi:hypothetical protein
MRTAMQRLGCSQGAAQAIVNEQGIDSIDELKALKDEDVVALCKVVRRPGGTVPNPNAAQADQPAQIPAVGQAIPIRAEQNIKLAAYYVRHMIDRISRPVTIADIDVTAVRGVREMKDAEDQYVKPDVKPTLDDKNWPKTFEAINDYFTRVRGEGGLPLRYVIRPLQAVTPEADDPAENYATNSVLEMIQRAPHFATAPAYTEAYKSNTLKVAEELTDIWRDHPGYTYGKAFLKAGDGRRGYFMLKEHYLGMNSVNDQSSAAETAIRNLMYNGEGRRWSFEKYATAMKEQHGVLDQLKEYGYSGRDETTKVRDLLGGIKTEALNAATSTILSTNEYLHNFDAAVNFIKSYMNQHNDQFQRGGTATRNIAEVSTRPNSKIEDRYYSAEEYKKLTVEQREELRQKRSKRGHKPGSKSSKVPPNKKSKFDRQVAQLTKQVSALTEKLEAQSKVPNVVSTDMSTSTTELTEQTNRSNPALSRQKTQGK